MADRAGLLARYERVPYSFLEAMFNACNTASTQGLLDLGSAAACSLAYEALLSQPFSRQLPRTDGLVAHASGEGRAVSGARSLL